MTTEQKMTDAPECVRQLASHQERLDQDGVMVGVSRQALDETLEYITRLREQLQWRPISEAPRDGTPLALKVHGLEHAVVGYYAIPRFTLPDDLYKPDKPVWIVYECSNVRVAFDECFILGWLPPPPVEREGG